MNYKHCYNAWIQNTSAVVENKTHEQEINAAIFDDKEHGFVIVAFATVSHKNRVSLAIHVC